MALTGELSDLSLAELIEFFCNQRKTGRIEVKYPTGPASFYLQSGAVVHAELGSLRGIEAVYYALTQANASFTFNSAVDAPAQTINQPWTSVVLEGLRRMDEGIAPPSPFPAGVAAPVAPEPVVQEPAVQEPVVEQQVALESSPIEPAPVVKDETPLVNAFDEPQIESVEVLDAEPEPIVSAAKEVPAISVPIVEAYPKPIVAVSPEVAKAAAPVAEEKPKPIVSAPQPVAPAPVMHQEAQADSVPKEKKQKRNKKQKTVGSTEFDVEPAGILAYHPKPAPAEVAPIFSQVGKGSSFSYGPWKLGAIFAAVVLVIAVVAVPWGWYARSKAAKMAPDAPKVSTDSSQPGAVNSSQDASSQTQSAGNEQAAVASDQSAAPANSPAAASENRPLHPKEEARKPKTETASANPTAPASASSSNQPVTSSQPTANAARKVTVTVTYDENGRVTQASGGDATALRIARQKRFPAGKGGSATVTIPIN
jgi:hypothetical protein